MTKPYNRKYYMTRREELLRKQRIRYHKRHPLNSRYYTNGYRNDSHNIKKTVNKSEFNVNEDGYIVLELDV